MINLLYGLILSFMLAYGAYKKDSLSISGFYAAIIVSTLLFFFGSFILWITLMAFFVSSSLLTKYKESQKKVHMAVNVNGGRRDYLQVLANGFLPVLFAIIYYFTNYIHFGVASAVTIATSNSDTWASELGVLSQGKTWSILNLQPIQRGLSGGISLLGTLASFSGATFIALIYSLMLYLFGITSLQSAIPIFVIITLGGVIGCFIDSYLGATIQARYKCPICLKITEHKHHHNHKTELKSGIRLVTNDVVNFTSACTASIIILLFLI
ncbi:DUF92 domain-containing protein [Haloplasma contractile]|uniref:Integral membrane DUF92 protein n=1 Tax=Haloplasma contractile SSD-17B TaxID=1033810 RepID=U2FGE4_9MOLU|nr:DUF92 domain-containing protein [Haloplasma contractile]ERJ11945.1 Integral membrane DUF92 protein [Haloplasma contractile SSD-17B]